MNATQKNLNYAKHALITLLLHTDIEVLLLVSARKSLEPKQQKFRTKTASKNSVHVAMYFNLISY